MRGVGMFVCAGIIGVGVCMCVLRASGVVGGYLV